jgi:hypothetical protein
LGVWRFREIARKALRRPPIEADDLSDALRLAASELSIPVQKWVEASRLIPHFLHQTRLERFFQ